MFIVTNRNIERDKGKVEEVFSKRPNKLGPNELRVAQVRKRRNGWFAEVLDDELPEDVVGDLKKDLNLPLDLAEKHYVDLLVACRLVQQARREKRNILVFIHGYNNDVEEVLVRAEQLEKHYDLIVLPFSWPANGGGLKGLADYKDDKNDAKASTVALDRFLNFIDRNLMILSRNNLERLWSEANRRHPNDPEKRDSLYTKLVKRDCPFSINLMLHSMGNYLLKQMLKSTASRGTGLIFDNIVMAAADTNNLDHALWVDRIRFRRRLYITINEDDQALAASRMKWGQGQLARLGHVLTGLKASRAHYINFTDSPYVGNSHAYFEGNARARNDTVKKFFGLVLNGKAADPLLKYRADINCYELRKR